MSDTDQQAPRVADTPPGTAPAPASTHAGLALALSASGTVIHFVLRNVGQTPLRLFGPVSGPDRRHYDYLRAELAAGGERRTLRFTGARNSSETGLVTLQPSAEIADDLDLTAWAIQPINGRQPLTSGEHEVWVSYELNQSGFWNGKVTAGPVAIHVP